MKKLFATSVFFLIFFQMVGFAQTASNNSNKAVYTVFYGRDFPNLEYPDDAKVEEGNMIDERKEGYWTRYYSDGLHIKLKGEYENNRPNGKYWKYYKDGTLKETGTFSRAIIVDSIKRYWENGKLEYEAFYSQEGKEQGKVNYYYKTGQLEYSYEAVNGKATNQKRYNPDGTSADLSAGNNTGIVETELFLKKITAPELKADELNEPFQPNGLNKIFKDNLIQQEGMYKNGRLYDGECYIYDETKKLIKIEIYKEGFLHSYGQI